MNHVFKNSPTPPPRLSQLLEQHNSTKPIPIANVTSPFSPASSPTVTHEHRKNFSIKKQPVSAKPPNNRKRGNSMSSRGSFLSVFPFFLNTKNFPFGKNRRFLFYKYTGTHKLKTGRWRAQIHTKFGLSHLGTYDSEYEAAMARDKEYGVLYCIGFSHFYRVFSLQ